MHDQVQQYSRGLRLFPKVVELRRSGQFAERSAFRDFHARPLELEHRTATERNVHQRPVVQDVLPPGHVVVAIAGQRRRNRLEDTPWVAGIPFAENTAMPVAGGICEFCKRTIVRALVLAGKPGTLIRSPVRGLMASRPFAAAKI